MKCSYILQKVLPVLLVVMMFLAACAPAALPTSSSPNGAPATVFPIPTETAPAGTPAPSETPAATGGAKDLPAAVIAAQQMLAQQLSVAADKIKVVSFEKVDWPNGCLGVQMPGRMCTQVITPGYKVLFQYDGKQYEFHTDETGGAIYSAVAPLPETAGKRVVWELTEGSTCTRAEIGSQNVAYGTCGSSLTEAALEPQRGEELAYLVATYANFFEGTQAGTVQFYGQGQQQPTQAEMRSIAEWAHLVYQEAESGRSGAAWGMAFGWHREGGIAGFCSDLVVYRTGWGMPSSCKTGQVKSFNNYRLSADELAQMYRWVDDYKSFEYQQADGNVSDAMKVTLTFTGNGSTEPTQQQKEAVAQFAAKIYSEAAQ